MKIYTRIAVEWATRCFGREHVYHAPIRALRLAEEAVEVAQAYQIPKEKMLDLVEIVYSRPRGSPDQELGGVALTASVLGAITMGRDLDDFLAVELLRVLDKPADHFARRNQEKLDLGLKT